MKILLVVYDNDSYIHWFPMGLGYIAAALLDAGYDVEIYNQDQHHYSDDHLRDYLDKNKYDVIGVSIVGGYYQYRKLQSISKAINSSKNRPFYIIGGHGPSPEPEFFLKKTKADVIVQGEGDITIIDLLSTWANQQPLDNVKGISFWSGSKVITNEKRPLISNIDDIPFPAYHLFPIEYYRLMRKPHATSSDFVMPVLSGRGCKYQCTFCYRMDKGFRPRSGKGITEEAKLLKQDYGITYISFDDELLMSSIERTINLCESFIKSKLGMKWSCNGRLNCARPDMLRLMKKAGCVFINYGIEAMDNQVLKNMRKGLTVDIITRGIKATLDAGISPGLNIIFGNLGDNHQVLDKDVEFLLQYSDGTQLRTIRPVIPYPGCPLYYYAIEKGLLKDCEDFYENKHTNSDLVTINFTDLTDDEFHKALLQANIKLITNYFEGKAQVAVEEARKLYIEGNKNFRGFRQT